MSLLENVSRAAETIRPQALQDIPRLLALVLPRSYRIADITNLVATCGARDWTKLSTEVLYATYACLAGGDRLARESEDEHLLPHIVSFSARHLSRQRTEADLSLRSEAALAILRLVSDLGQSLDADVLVRTIPFTNPDSTPNSCRLIAQDILSQQLDPRRKAAFIVHTILEGLIRPIMIGVPSKRLTPAGRKLEYDADLGDVGGRTLDVPWKGDGAHLALIFRWAVFESDVTLVRINWPLFMPLLVALLDDPESSTRARGLDIVKAFIQRCPPEILRDRGIGMLLEDAILPTLHFLPSITPEEESATLQSLAFGALLQLSRSQFNRDQDQVARYRLLHRLLREGVLAGFAHASEYVDVVHVLALQMAAIVDELGIYATKQLKDLIPMCGAILMNPFLVRQPACLVAAAKALEVILLNCWPRISVHYVGDIIRAISVSWLNVADANSKEISGPERQEAELCLRKLAALVSSLTPSQDEQKPRGSSEEGLKPIRGHHAALRGLFQTDDTVIGS